MASAILILGCVMFCSVQSLHTTSDFQDCKNVGYNSIPGYSVDVSLHPAHDLSLFRTSFSHCLYMCSDRTWCKAVETHTTSTFCRLFGAFDETYLKPHASAIISVKTCKEKPPKIPVKAYKGPTTFPPYLPGHSPPPVTMSDGRTTTRDPYAATMDPELVAHPNRPDWSQRVEGTLPMVGGWASSILNFFTNVLHPRTPLNPNSIDQIKPGAGTRPKATKPPQLDLGTMGDSGRCPDPLAIIPNYYLPGGIETIRAVSRNECKKACIQNPECEAVDYVKATRACVVHGAMDLLRYDRGMEAQPCCDHYHKTHCSPRRCYSHDLILMMDKDDGGDSLMSVGPTTVEDTESGVSLQVCPGMCVIEETIEIGDNGTRMNNHTLERQCDPSGKVSGTFCSLTTEETPEGDATYKVYCKCDADNCNALGVGILQGLALYLPFDDDAKDFSGSNRHGDTFELEYDSADRKKGHSAYFNGNAYAIVLGLDNYLIGMITEYENQRIPSLTLTLWFKRIRHPYFVGEMTLLSNGVVEVTSHMSRDNTQIIDASVVLVDGMEYSVRARVPINEWVFLAVRLGVDYDLEMKEFGRLDIFTTEEDMMMETPTNTLSVAPYPIRQSPYPLFIGRHPISHNTNQGFYGFMDEVMIFSDSLSGDQLMAIRNLEDSII